MLCEYLLESLNFVAFMQPNKQKMKSEGFSTTWPNLFSNTFVTENFSVFCKVLSQFTFCHMIEPLPKFQTRHPACSQAPLHLPHVPF